MRIGIGYDIHRLVGGRPLILGGVRIDYPQGPLGHSDGDVLAHAVVDALLGAAGLGDIGTHFPPSDPQWKDAPGRVLLTQTLTLVHAAGFSPHNIDATVLLERPMLAPYMPHMRATLASALGLSEDRVNIKAKTNEGLDAVGQRQAIAAHVVVLLDER